MGGDPGERGWDLGDVSPPTFLNVNPPKGKFLQKIFFRRVPNCMGMGHLNHLFFTMFNAQALRLHLLGANSSKLYLPFIR